MVIFGQNLSQVRKGVAFGSIGAGHPGSMRIVEPQVHETGLRSFFTSQEVERFIDKKGGAVPALNRIMRGPDPICPGDLWVGFGTFVGADPLVITVGGELGSVLHVSTAAKMPLANMRGSITRGLQ